MGRVVPRESRKSRPRGLDGGPFVSEESGDASSLLPASLCRKKLILVSIGSKRGIFLASLSRFIPSKRPC